MIARSVAIGVAVVLSLASGAAAQTRPAPRSSTFNPERRVAIRGFGDVGGITFTASESFKAVLGSASGVAVGGGIEAVLPRGIAVGLRVSRFRKSGHRVFVHDGEVFDLGIDTEVTITPVEVSGGYRFGSSRSRIVPYAAAGIGWHRYKETSEFADAGDDVRETHRGYHVLGGAEIRITRWLGAAGEAQWTTVPDALGQHADAASAALGETDLGGAAFRVKVVIGR